MPENGPREQTLGIVETGRSDPYPEDGDGSDDLLAYFEDEDASDEVGAPPEPATFEDDDEENPQPAPPPEDDDETVAAPSDLVTEGTTDEEIEQEVRLLAGRFPDTDEGLAQLERSYGEVQGAFTRTTQELRRADERQNELEQLIAQQQSQMDQLTQAVTAQMAEADPEFAERLQRQQEINQAVQARIDAEFEDVDEDQEAFEQSQAVARANIASFYQRTGISPNGPEDQRMERAMQIAFQAGVPIDLRQPQHLDAILEASRDDNLLLELTMAPNAINVPGGMEHLKGRLSAGTIPPTTAAPSPEQETRPRSTQPPRRRRVEGHVESPGGGAPAPAAPATGDEFDEAADFYRKRFNKGPIFGGRR